MSISDAIGKDLDAMPEGVRSSGLAEAARSIARMLDSASNDVDGSYRDAAALLKELRATMGELRALAAVTPGQEDDVDRLTDAGPREPGTVVPLRPPGGYVHQLGAGLL